MAEESRGSDQVTLDQEPERSEGIRHEISREGVLEAEEIVGTKAWSQH